MPQYNPPPNWPAPPPGWTPPAGWKAPANWPPPPKGWKLWLPAKKERRQSVGYPGSSPASVTRPRPLPRYRFLIHKDIFRRLRDWRNREPVNLDAMDGRGHGPGRHYPDDDASHTHT